MSSSDGLLSHLPGLLLLAVGAYLVLLLTLFLAQARLIYLPDIPSRALLATPARLGLAFEELNLVTEDGVRLHAWLVPAPGARGTLLFAHGNAGNISHRLDSIEIFHQLGLDVLIFDYRGYGDSTGRPSELGTYRDIEAAWRELTERRGVAPGRIVVFGRSLGAAVAAWLATRERPAGLILESAFTSLPDLAADIYPFLPARYLVRFQYPSERYLTEARAPVLIVHSRDDEIVPFRHGQRLAQVAGAELLELRGTHNDGFLRRPALYQAGLDRFLERVLGPE